jgi:hypothetical protein
MHKSATKYNETVGKWCKNKHGASKIIDTFKTYQSLPRKPSNFSLTPLASYKKISYRKLWISNRSSAGLLLHHLAIFLDSPRCFSILSSTYFCWLFNNLELSMANPNRQNPDEQVKFLQYFARMHKQNCTPSDPYYSSLI